MTSHSFSVCCTMALTAMMFPLTVSPLSAQTQIDSRYPIHDRSRPLPPVVDPGTSSTPTLAGRPPSTASSRRW